MNHEVLHELEAIDRGVYDAVARQSTPTVDGALRRVSNMANRSALWLAIAGVLAATGGSPGRRAAGRGLVSIAVSSAVVNAGLKSVHRRPRPDRQHSGSPVDRHVAMPSSPSFPSGHSASAFAFANAVGVELPLLAVPLRVLAAVVAYSRVHTGVHYPSDAIAGALLGASTGQLVAQGMDLWLHE